MENVNKVLQALKEAKQPLSQKEVEAITGLDTKEVDKAFKALKKDELIVSKVRCKWEPK
ncbi:MAG TPA: transcriptional regulator [Firmicutes bacterium]|jgi:predicted transcriptional regulator|nr:transcriptional regulator [Bacillota bacterium]